MKDNNLRSALIRRLARRYSADPNINILEELGLRHGAARIDIVAVNGARSCDSRGWTSPHTRSYWHGARVVGDTEGRNGTARRGTLLLAQEELRRACNNPCPEALAIAKLGLTPRHGSS
jgi:hypothetical protein